MYNIENKNEGSKKGDKILIYAVGVILLGLLIASYFAFSPKNNEVGAKVFTDKDNYKIGSTLKVDIKNESNKKICFSSCSPYYFEKKDGGWEKYLYENCSKEDRAEECISPKKIKAFELNVPPVKKGINRLVIPACIGCAIKDKFRKDKLFYSNEFIVK